jgi:uncharacterized membrane protein
VATPEERGLERLILFSDAVVAIAITLLVLPLTDLEPAEEQSALGLLREHWDEVLAFAISFIVIARFWFAHHRIFRNLMRHDSVLLVLNTAWLASVVLMPFSTAVVEFQDGYATLYLINLLLTSLLTVLMASYIYAHPELVETPPSPTAARRSQLGGWTMVGTIGVALILSFFLDHAALLFLFGIPVLQRIVDRRTPDEVTV